MTRTLNHLADEIESKSGGRQGAGRGPDKPERPRLGKEAIAVATLMEHRDWTNQEVADEVGCHVKSLSSAAWGKFRAARNALASGRANLPTGTKDKGTGDLEAWKDGG